MSAMASQITSRTIVYSIVYSRQRSRKTSKLRVIGLCEGNPPLADEFPAQRAVTRKKMSIWWRHHVMLFFLSWSLGDINCSLWGGLGCHGEHTTLLPGRRGNRLNYGHDRYWRGCYQTFDILYDSFWKWLNKVRNTNTIDTMGHITLRFGSAFSMKMRSYKYKKWGVIKSSYLNSGIDYTDKMTSWYWINHRPLQLNCRSSSNSNLSGPQHSIRT